MEITDNQKASAKKTNAANSKKGGEIKKELLCKWKVRIWMGEVRFYEKFHSLRRCRNDANKLCFKGNMWDIWRLNTEISVLVEVLNCFYPWMVHHRLKSIIWSESFRWSFLKQLIYNNSIQIYNKWTSFSQLFSNQRTYSWLYNSLIRWLPEVWSLCTQLRCWGSSERLDFSLE